MEYGSEFDFNDFHELNDIVVPNWLNLGEDNRLLFSGRTAIDLVIEDIKINKSIKNVYMPSYCCDSMLRPFIDNNINLVFYDVTYNDKFTYNIDYNKEIDIFYCMNYFGFSDEDLDNIIYRFKSKGVTVIEDVTHRVFSRQRFSLYSDYLVASLTKWIPLISCGIASKIKGEFKQIKLSSPNYSLINIKKSAMESKNIYLYKENQLELKNKFLYQFNIFNSSIDNHYQKLIVDKYSNYIINNIEIRNLIDKRLENYIYLNNNIINGQLINMLNYNEGDTPIFLPIIVRAGKRDVFKQFLINNNIYCPIHWPKSASNTSEESDFIYDNIISIICDHRYNEIDMKKIVAIINEFT